MSDTSRTPAHEFRMKEYDALLEKMAHARSDVARLETVYPLAIVSIYAWVFSKPPAIALLWNVVLILPAAIAILGIVRLFSRRRGMDLLEAYIREIEGEVYGPESTWGWERRYSRERPLKWLIGLRAVLAFVIVIGTIWIAYQSDCLFRQVQQAAAAPH